MLQTGRLARSRVLRGEPGAPASVDGLDLARRCAAWQSALPHAEIVFPASVLALTPAAKFVRGQVRDRRALLGVHNEQELGLAIAACIHPTRVVFRCDNAVTRTIWHAVGLGVGLFVVNAQRQLTTISACAPQRQRVLVDAAEPVEGLLPRLIAATATERLELTGVHCQLDTDHQTARQIEAVEVIGQVARLFHERAAVFSSISLAVSEPVSGSPDTVLARVEAVSDAVAAECRRLGLPPPAVLVSPN